MFDSVKWIYILENDHAWPSKLPIDEDCAFVDRYGVRRLELRKGGEVKVLKSYAWDGCTPKFAFWDIVFGTPDGIPHQVSKKPKTYYASLLHDALYQFLGSGLPLTRKQVDTIFLKIMKEYRFGPCWIYYFAVRVFGGAFRIFTSWKRQHRGEKVPL